jgi:hypothetical protein
MTRWFGVPGVWRRGCFAAAGVVLLLAGAGGRAHADEAFRCELREARGVPEADAATAAELVCGEIRRASGAAGVYGVSLATLGRTVVVTARREAPAASVTVDVDGLEELPKAAPRIADALVHGLGFATTQRVDNLLVAETRPDRVKKGSVKFCASVAHVESLGYGARASGFSLGLMYAAPRFALPVDMRFAWNDAAYGEKSLSLFAVSVGGRYYLSRKNVSPFVGGGVGILHVDASEYSETGGFYDERWGGAFYAEAGVEMLRLHRGRIAFLVRADFPTASLQREAYGSWSSYDSMYYGDEPTAVPAESRYVVPVSIGVSVAF